MIMRFFLICVMLIVSQQVLAQDDADLQALKLADLATTKPESASDWRVFIEASAGGSILRDANSFQPEQRLSFDLQYDNTFAPGWRAVFADRLDADNPAQPPASNTINTIKEAYLSWQSRPDLLFDFGRINDRNGVALGYNPTDYFKTNAVRSYVSVDPNSLKENRQGSVMLRAQELFDSGSVTVLFSPKIDGQVDYASFNPDFAATNSENRWLVSYSPKIMEGLNPQFLVFQSAQLPTQFGLNLTSLINDASVVYAEWSGGRNPSLLAQSLQQQGLPFEYDTAFRNRIASGVTYTTDNKISVTAELEYNGAGLDQNQWNTLWTGPIEIYGVYRNWLNVTQESPSKRAAFFFGGWQDALINHLDLSAMERFNLDDSSRLSWLEARYHLTHTEFALQWQLNSGSRLSEYGAAAQTQTWALVGRYYF
jgi:hypothetical protein